jgi:hypothetical protein
VLYTIGVVGFVLFSWWWAWWCSKHVETPINTSSFLHLVGYLFTFATLLLRKIDFKWSTTGVNEISKNLDVILKL